MLVASLCVAACLMLVIGGIARGIYLWTNRHQIRQNLVQSRLDQLRHEAEMIGLEDTLRGFPRNWQVR